MLSIVNNCPFHKADAGGEATLPYTAGHNILGYANTPSNMPREILKSMFMNPFFTVFLFYFGHKQKYIFT